MSGLPHSAEVGQPSQAHAVGFSVSPYGDSALLVTFTAEQPDVAWRAAQGLADYVERRAVSGVEDVVATFDAILIAFDPIRLKFGALQALIADWRINAIGPENSLRRLFHMPVAYGGEYGPDLEVVARVLDCAPEDVIALHTSTDWTIRFLGAPGGAPLHDGPTFPTPIPRVTTPRTRLAAGSVGLSGSQGIIYPVSSPGGWQIIGRTPTQLVDFSREPFAEHRPGDLVRFHRCETYPGDLALTPVWSEA